jgi:hypothetical protein
MIAKETGYPLAGSEDEKSRVDLTAYNARKSANALLMKNAAAIPDKRRAELLSSIGEFLHKVLRARSIALSQQRLSNGLLFWFAGTL